MSRREHISLKTKLAAALCVILDIPHEHQKLMTEDQVLSLAQWDHYPIRRIDGLALGMSTEEVDRFSNIGARPIMAHREKTAKVDLPQMAKSQRNRDAEAEHHAVMRRKMLALGDEQARCCSRWPKGRKIPSRPMRRAVR